MKDRERKARILVVDDEPDQVVLLKAILAPQGYEVLSSSSGEETLEFITSHEIDLVLLDVKMPGIDGFEVTRRLKANEKTKFTPVVLTSVLKDTNSRIKGIEAGSDDYICKSADKNELLSKIKSLLKIKFLYGELEDNYKKLKELEKLKYDLTYIIFHDLTNSLAAILGGMQLVKFEGVERFTPRQKHNFEIVFLAAKDLNRMISNLLDINKIEEGTLKPRCQDFKLDTAVKELVDEIKTIARSHTKNISLEIGEDMPTISGDQGLIRSTIVDLINNALRFTPSNGTVAVKVFYSKEENNFYFQVKDTGSGIPKEYLDRVFEKLIKTETKKVRVGRGLGLTFCKMVIELHGGNIWVESEPGKGSLFSFTLPHKT